MTVIVHTDAATAAQAEAALAGLHTVDGEAIRAKRRAAVERDRATPPPKPERVTTPSREALDSIVVTLPDGREVLFGPPSGVSLAVRRSAFFRGRDPSREERAMTNIAFCVRAIDGRTIEPVVSDLHRDRLLNDIGDVGLEILDHRLMVHWPPAQESDLLEVKKNYRTTP